MLIPNRAAALLLALSPLALTSATAQGLFPTGQHAPGAQGSPWEDSRRSERKVLMVGIDGCRPDALEVAASPNLDRLVSEGAYSNQASNVLPTSSGPNWSSLLTGTTPAKHGVTDNSFAGSNFDQYPHFFTRLEESEPSLFKASFVRWTPIHTEIVSDADISLGNLSDPQVANQAHAQLSSGDQDVIFLHFDEVEVTGTP